MFAEHRKNHIRKKMKETEYEYNVLMESVPNSRSSGYAKVCINFIYNRKYFV